MSIPFDRPKYNPTISKNIKTMNTIAIFLLLILWCFTCLMYMHAPEKVPMHFNAKGDVDSYGGKISLFLLPLIGTIIFVGLHYLAKVPYIYNYPFTITEKNFANAYKSASNMMYIVKFLIVLLFADIQCMIYKALNHETTTFYTVLLIIILISITVVPITLASRVVKDK
jgi:uncharacterized membrane protein